MNIVCIGSGYVGSVTAAAFAVLGHQTTVIDVNPDKVASIQSGRSPIYEPGLDRLLQAVAGRSLTASVSYESVKKADAVFICVGTPSKPDGSADMTFVESAAAQIAEHLDSSRFTVVVTKSTVPVGTADTITRIVGERSGLSSGVQYAVVSNPEFLREGHALEDVFFPDRIVIGANDPKARDIMKAVYTPLLRREFYKVWLPQFEFHCPMDKPAPVYLETDPASSEMIKYASNAFLAVKVSYINEIARYCEQIGANALHVAYGMGLDDRIGSRFLQISSGWGGSCFPKDTLEFLASSIKQGSELSIVKAAVQANHAMQQYCADKVRSRLGDLSGKVVAILGLTFKPDTDDARQSQAAVIIRELTDRGAAVQAHDPKGANMFALLNPELPVTYCVSPEEAAARSDAIVLMTHWDEYLRLDWRSILPLMNRPYLLDTRNALPEAHLREIGFEYEGLGIPHRN